MQDIGKIYRFSKIDTLPIILFKILRGCPRKNG